MDNRTPTQAIADVGQLNLPAAPPRVLRATVAPQHCSSGPAVVAVGAVAPQSIDNTGTIGLCGHGNGAR